MPTRLAAAFDGARGSTGLIPFLTAGYPSLDQSLDMMRGFDAAGCLAIEVGIPFSDPIADGPDIQRASEWALRAHVGTADVLALAARFREASRRPIVVMTYVNPVLRYGLERFAHDAVRAGVDGVILSDLPADELPEAWHALDAVGLDTVLLVAPTTDASRLPALLQRSRGFVYCLARTGVTGRGGGSGAGLPQRIAALRALTRLPIAVGFGISTPDDARTLAGTADAVIVGAAFMRAVTADPERGAPDRTRALAESLIEALRG